MRSTGAFSPLSRTSHASSLVTCSASVLSWHDTLVVAGTIELADTSWLNPDKIGNTMRIGSFGARVEFDIGVVLSDEAPSYEDALWFACKELNPMLETFTTLFGIKNDIDITVEHGLRPVTKLLQNIVQPHPRTGKTFRSFT